MLKYTYAILCSAFFSSAAHAQALPSYCDKTEKIDVPIYAGDAASPTFSYSYRHVRRSPDTTTVIFLPGGPGSTSIYFGMSDAAMQTLLPLRYNLVLTDPRGIGCNAHIGPELQPNAFSTENLASDVLYLINHLGIRNYIIMGHSYGTLLATVVASKAYAGAAPPPKAIVLQGVVGQVLSDPYGGFIREWEAVKSSLPAQITQKLKTAPLPFGLSPLFWGAFISGELIAGTLDGQPNLAAQLAPLAGGDPNALSNLKQAVIARGSHQSSPDFLRLYKPIWCNEISSSDNVDMALLKGNLVGNQVPKFCDGYSLSRPYNSKDWRLAGTIFYIQGDHDPATTPNHALYHFQNHREAKRFLVKVPGAGHAPFPALGDCRNKIWDSIDRLGFGFAEAMKRCSIRPTWELGIPDKSR